MTRQGLPKTNEAPGLMRRAYEKAVVPETYEQLLLENLSGVRKFEEQADTKAEAVVRRPYFLRMNERVTFRRWVKSRSFP
jgi:hypothetical protein